MPRRLLLTAVLALTVAATGSAPARAEQSDNVKLVASIPEMRAAISINFIDDTMFVSTVHGVYAYGVADPAAPSLIGVLPMYIWENEDVDVDPARKRLFISRDPRGFTSPAVPGSVFPFGAVHIIDVSLPHLMTQLNVFTLPAGHTTTCVNKCDFIWTAGPGANQVEQPADFVGRPVYATDVTDAMNPKPCPDPIDIGRNDGVTDYAHDVQVDALGIAWVAGAGGVRGYWTQGQHVNPVSGALETATGCKPIPYAGSGTPDKETTSRFMHNSWRDWTTPPPAAPVVTKPKAKAKKKASKRSKCTRKSKSKSKSKKKSKQRKCAKPKRKAKKRVAAGISRNDVLLGTEENIVSDCATSGRFVTYDLRSTYGGEGFKDTKATHHRMKVLDIWTPEKQPGASGCASSHYFTSRGDGITANAFYEQGVRFLDSSDPTDIRQVGYYANADSNTWAAYWHKGFVFVADLVRGVEVLQFSGAAGKSRTVRAPFLSTHSKQTLRFSSDVFGGLCPLRAPSA